MRPTVIIAFRFSKMTRQLTLSVGAFVAVTALAFVAHAAPVAENLKFVIVRNGENIGTTTLSVERNGAQTVTQVASAPLPHRRQWHSARCHRPARWYCARG